MTKVIIVAEFDWELEDPEDYDLNKECHPVFTKKDLQSHINDGLISLSKMKPDRITVKDKEY